MAMTIAPGRVQRHYGGRAANMDVEYHGPLFNPFVTRQLVQAINGTIKDLLSEAEAAAKGVLGPGHGELTGQFKRSITGDLKKDLLGIVRSTDPRPIRTFLETGVRTNKRARAITRGKRKGEMTNRYRVGQGYRMFRTGRQAVKDAPERLAAAVAGVLE